MKLFIVALMTLSFSASAQEKGEMFDSAKAEMIKHLDARISELQEAKSCVSSAQDREAMKKCRQNMKEGMGEIKENAREVRKDFRNKRDELREKKRAEKMKNRQ